MKTQKPLDAVGWLGTEGGRAVIIWEQRVKELERKLADERAPNDRWNKAASKAGICGSEYINDPEAVFNRVVALRSVQHTVFIQAMKRLERAEARLEGVRATEEAVRSLSDLQQDWNSYGAPPISIEAQETALVMLQPPAVVPTSHGGIQLEWHDHRVDIEVVIGPCGRLAE